MNVIEKIFTTDELITFARLLVGIHIAIMAYALIDLALQLS